MPIDESVAHLQLVVGFGIELREPGRDRPIPMSEAAAERMCADLDARGEHEEAARHRRDLQFFQTVAQRIASRRRAAEGSPSSSQPEGR